MTIRLVAAVPIPAGTPDTDTFQVNIYQFNGYQYAKKLAAITPDKSQLFENVGNIYWYNEQRNSYNLSLLTNGDKPQIDSIRSFLASAYNYHLAVTKKQRKIQEGEFDFYGKIEN